MSNEKIGIYGIECEPTKKCYVGSSSRIYRRWAEHRSRLRKGTHHTPYLQHAWTAYGEAAFKFYIIEECDKTALEDREQYYIDTFNPAFNAMRDVKRQVGPEVLVKRAAVLRARAALIMHCPKGHAYSEENTFLSKKNKRICRRCAYERNLRVFQTETPEHREIRLQRANSYYHKNREKLLAQQTAYAAGRKDQKREYDRQYRERKKRTVQSP